MKSKEFKTVNFNKTGVGNSVGRVILRKEWLNDMNITSDEPWIELSYDENEKKIVIEKKN